MILTSKSNLEEEEPGSIMVPSFKPYYEDIVIETDWYRHSTQSDETERKAQKQAHKYTLNSLMEKTENMRWGKDSVSNKGCCGTQAATGKRLEPDRLLTPHTNTNTKCNRPRRKTFCPGKETMSKMSGNLPRGRK